MHFLKKIKLQIIIPLLILFIIPINIYAYSKYIIPGGETIGIEVNSKGILVVGFYEVESKYIGKDAGFLIGDTITKINDTKVETINEMVDAVNSEAEKNNQLDVTIIRNDKSSNLTLNMICDSSNVCKTGLYVKDEITSQLPEQLMPEMTAGRYPEQSGVSPMLRLLPHCSASSVR